MQCSEMKELELLCQKFVERRKQSEASNIERRTQLGLVRRVGQARVAYLMQLHRVRCIGLQISDEYVRIDRPG